MTKTLTSAQLEQLRRNAKHLARTEDISLNEAQNRLAAEHGFRNWSLLAKSVALREPVASATSTVASASLVDARPRHYVHGDQSEKDLDLYNCRQCDLSWPAAHFEFEHGQKTVERFLQDLKYWQRRPATWQRGWRRPDDAVNALAEPAQALLAGQAVREATRSPFNRWLLAQTNRDDPVGDIARDAKSDENFPVAENSLAALLAYLSNATFSERPAAALRGAYSEFEASL